MLEKTPENAKILAEDALEPQHESWARLTTHNSLVGLAIALGLAALFIVVIDLRLKPIALAILGALGVLVLLALIWRCMPPHRRGFLGNAGLTARIKADMLTELGANNVNVDSSKGVVTLRGTVPYPDFLEAAESLAKRGGAHEVINKLTAPPAAHPPDPYLQGFPGVTTPEGAPEAPALIPLETLVREALEADPRVDAYVLIVQVEDAMAYLTGRQDTVQARDAATEVALQVPGILAVSNDIEIMPSV